MTTRSTRTIGLSLGADLCWPACYEAIVRDMKLELALGSDVVDFAIERVTVEPFSLQQPCRYDIVLDRLTHWFTTSREWIKKAVVMDGLYVLNNPWTLQSMEKQTTYAAMMHLGLNVPETWMVPPREHEPGPDVGPTLQRYAKLFELGDVGEKLGYPLFMKPYDGGGWVGVTKIDDRKTLDATYAASGKRVMHLQKAIPYDIFVRTIGIGPQVEVIRYDPERPLHDRYQVDFFFVDGDEWSLLVDQQLTINGFFGWEFNSCESLRADKRFYPIDFANACPDFQVTSLHYHFPILVKNMLRWSLFCAATKREMKRMPDWEPYYAVQRRDLPFRERLAAYADITRERMEHDRFTEFCATHLSHLDEVTWTFFGTDAARAIVREKVASLYPEHEIERFTAHFWGLLQFWRKTERDRLDHIGAKSPNEAAKATKPKATKPKAKRRATTASSTNASSTKANAAKAGVTKAASTKTKATRAKAPKAGDGVPS